MCLYNIEFNKRVEEKKKNVRLVDNFYHFFATSLIYSIMQEHEHDECYFEISFLTLRGSSYKFLN